MNKQLLLVLVASFMAVTVATVIETAPDTPEEQELEELLKGKEID